MPAFKKRLLIIWDKILYFFSDEEDPNEPIYDPVHLGGMIVVVFAAMGCLYWLLWTLLVYQGGIFPKIPAILAVVFTGKTLQDYGWEGYPYEMGVFNGWVGNGIALLLTFLVLGLITWIFRQQKSNGRSA